MHAGDGQLSGKGCSIAAVVSRATEDSCRLAFEVFGKFGRDGAQGRGRSRLHQQHRRGCILLDCKSINLTHLGGCNDGLHALDDRSKVNAGQSGGPGSAGFPACVGGAGGSFESLKRCHRKWQARWEAVRSQESKTKTSAKRGPFRLLPLHHRPFSRIFKVKA